MNQVIAMIDHQAHENLKNRLFEVLDRNERLTRSNEILRESVRAQEQQYKEMVAGYDADIADLKNENRNARIDADLTRDRAEWIAHEMQALAKVLDKRDQEIARLMGSIQERDVALEQLPWNDREAK